MKDSRTGAQVRHVDLERARQLSLKCSRDELTDPNWEKYDATDWHSESAEDLGLDYDAAGAHIAYWFAWLVENDLDSGFVCTDSEELIRGYVVALNRVKDRKPGAINGMLDHAEQLGGSMMSEAGNRFTKSYYGRYLKDYAQLFGRDYSPFSEENYARVREMLEKNYGPYLPPR